VFVCSCVRVLCAYVFVVCFSVCVFVDKQIFSSRCALLCVFVFSHVCLCAFVCEYLCFFDVAFVCVFVMLSLRPCACFGCVCLCVFPVGCFLS